MPDEAFISRPKIRNSLDVSNISELFAEDVASPIRTGENQSIVETSFAGNSKLVDAVVREGEPLDKTWIPMTSSPTRSVPRSARRNRHSIVEQSLQSSSKLVFPEDSERSTDEELLAAFSKSVPTDSVPQLESVQEEKTPKESDYSLPVKEHKSPSEKFAMVANFLEVEPMVSPSTNNRSAATAASFTPRTPPRSALNGSFKENIVPEEAPKIDEAERSFPVTEPTQEQWQEMLNASQGSLPESIPEEDADDNALNNTNMKKILDSTNVSGIEDEALI